MKKNILVVSIPNKNYLYRNWVKIIITFLGQVSFIIFTSVFQILLDWDYVSNFIFIIYLKFIIRIICWTRAYLYCFSSTSSFTNRYRRSRFYMWLFFIWLNTKVWKKGNLYDPTGGWLIYFVWTVIIYEYTSWLFWERKKWHWKFSVCFVNYIIKYDIFFNIKRQCYEKS